MKTIADTLGVSRSNQVEKARQERQAPSSESPLPQGPCAKPDDLLLLPAIRALVSARQTYGYRRITALLNRAQRKAGLQPVNRKRVLRVMQAHSMVLARHTALRQARTHDGVVIALRSNIRWCSDDLELKCRNGDIARVRFVIDACDREIIAYSAGAHAGISGEMVRDPMVEAVERRFGTTKTPHPVEWLSDNGSAYIAKETATTATALGLTLAFTPVRSPESNGISEAFVKTLKPDYARCTVLPDAETTPRLIPEWIDDHTESHPHSGLRFLSPREFSKSPKVRNLNRSLSGETGCTPSRSS